MTPHDAAALLDIPADATVEQLESRFLELRRKLEDKIAKAPTPGLQAKYRASLAQITEAFESLTLAADSSSLPMLQRAEPPAAAPSRSTPSIAPASPNTSPAKKKSGNKEFVVVALIAIAVLGAGGGWIVKSRADNAERARLAAEAKAASEAETLRLKQAEEARAAEVARRASELRTELATTKVAWEALENRLREAERRTSELKGELRGFRDGPAWKKAELSALAHRHELYSAWFNEYLASHVAKVARAKAEQLLSDNLVDEAAEAVAEMKQALDELQTFVAERAGRMLDGSSEVVIESKPEGVKFVFTDPYGRTTEGVTPARLPGQPLSHMHDPKYDGDAGDTEIQLGEFSVEPSVRFVRPGWKDVVRSSRTALDHTYFEAEFAEGSLEIFSNPSGLPFTVTQLPDLGWAASGNAPATLENVPVGKVQVTVDRAAYGKISQNLEVKRGQIVRSLPLGPKSQEVNISVAEAQAKIFVDKKLVGRGKATLRDMVPGEHALQIEANGYPPFRTKFKVSVSAEKLPPLHYSIKELAVQNVTCANCRGAGNLARQRTCSDCRGSKKVRCYDCPGNGIAGYVQGDFGGGVMGPKMVRCSTCSGKGKLPCNGCQDGRIYWNDHCTPCNGDGRVSQLQLSQ